MKNLRSVLIAVFVLICISCQQTQKPADNYQDVEKQKIAKLDKLYFEAWGNKDLDSTMTFLDEGFINMYSFGSSETKEQCRKSWKNVFDSYSLTDVEYKSTECVIDKNYAFEIGLLKQKWITNDKKDTIISNTRGLSVFKKQNDGSWKMFRLIGQQ